MKINLCKRLVNLMVFFKPINKRIRMINNSLEYILTKLCCYSLKFSLILGVGLDRQSPIRYNN